MLLQKSDNSVNEEIYIMLMYKITTILKILEPIKINF